MTTENQNHWASHLEDASQREIRQMAEYAIEFLTQFHRLPDDIQLELWRCLKAMFEDDE